MTVCCNLVMCSFQSRSQEDEADAGSRPDEELEDAVCPEAFAELVDELCVDDAFSDHDTTSLNSKKNQSKKRNARSSVDAASKLDLDAIVVKAPLAGEICRKGNIVYCNGSKCGSISYLLHWSPAAISGTCAVHTDCFMTCPLLTGDEDSIVRWLGEAYCFQNAADHGTATPPGSYHRRRPY